MGKFITGKVDFAALIPQEYPPVGEFLFGFDTADDQLKKIDNLGNLTSVGGGGTPAPTNITYSALLALYNAQSMVPGFYNITDRADAGVILEAITPSTLSVSGVGLFMNPDFQFIGNYTGVTPAYNSTLGIWYPGMTPTTGDIAFYNGNHFVNLTGAVGTAPDGDGTNWLYLPRTQANVGYVVEADYIEYNFSLDYISKRRDKRGNTFGPNWPYFCWGDDSKALNTCDTGYVFNYNQRNGFNSNFISATGVIITETGYPLVQLCHFTGGSNIAFYVDGDYRNLSIQSGPNEFPELDSTTQPVPGFYDKTANGLGSSFELSFDVTGLTTLNILKKNSYIGLITMTSTNPKESIDLFLNFTPEHPVRFKPAAGKKITFVNGTGIGQPQCVGGVDLVLDGDRGDWVEFTTEEVSPFSFTYYIKETGRSVSAGKPKVYKAILSQFGGAVAPFETDMLGNTNTPLISTLPSAWSYVSTGQYKFTSVGAFVDMSKVNIEIADNRYNGGFANYFGFDYQFDNDSIVFKSYTITLPSGPAVSANDIIWLQPITIEIYP